MSKVFQGIGKVAGIVATVAAFIPGGQPIALIAAGVAAAASIGASLTAVKPKKPPQLGSATEVTIGADQPQPYMMGDTYCGGARQHQVGYGPEIDDVPNPYAALVDVYSCGGPIAGIDHYYTDFTEVPFSGSSATGYYAGFLYRDFQLGATPEAAALTGNWGAIPDWGAGHPISGKPAVLWSLKWDASDGKFGSGVPQLGIRGRGVLTYDPRLDDSYPGGAGDHRWVDPKAEPAGHAAAKPSWSYDANPALHGLRYALGTWERRPGDDDAVFVLTFGVGFPFDGIIVEDFVEWANVCDANGWEISGVIYEPGDKWANFKRICEAGGAEPVFKGGRLGIKVSAPRVSLDTIRMDDIADGDPVVPGMQPWQDRINTIIPKYKSPDHKWELQQSAAISDPAFVAADGEVKRREEPFETVKSAGQAAVLAAYKLYEAREQGPITIPVMPRLRGYFAGDRLTLASDLAEFLGVAEPEIVVLTREFDPQSMTGTLTIVTETATKHAAALAATGTVPAAITIVDPADLDGVYNSVRNRTRTADVAGVAGAVADGSYAFSAVDINALQDRIAALEGA